MPVACAIFQLDDGNGQLNEVLFRPGSKIESDELVVLFPGDISDFPTSDQRNALTVGLSEFGRYDFTLDAILRGISEHLLDHQSCVVFRPSRMIGHCCVYSNFLNCGITGIPTWEESRHRRPGQILLNFLEHLIQLSGGKISSKTRLILAGFSKGCIVLSTLIRDMDLDLIARVDKWVMIDPGIQQPRTLFPFTEEEYLNVRKLNISLTVYVTPYQVGDDARSHRPWLHKEILHFVDSMDAELIYILKDNEGSLETHFKAITVAIEREISDI
jgi:hypothetical protein